MSTWRTINGHYFEVRNEKAICKFCESELKSASYLNIPWTKIPDIIGFVYCPRKDK